MLCDQMRSNTIYQVVKVLKQDQIIFETTSLGHCSDSKTCLQDLSDQDNYNNLIKNAVSSDLDIHKESDVKELSSREIIEFNSANEKLYFGTIKENNLKEQISDSTSNFTLRDKSISNRASELKELTTREIIEFSPVDKDVFFGTIKDKKLNDQISNLTSNFTLTDKSMSVVQRSEEVIRKSVIYFWQYLMFFGLMLIYIIICWILLKLLIELFALNFRTN
jgi:hypothetical protein